MLYIKYYLFNNIKLCFLSVEFIGQKNVFIIQNLIPDETKYFIMKKILMMKIFGKMIL